MTDHSKPSEEFKKFDKAMDKIMSVSKADLDKRLAAAKAAKTGKRYPKPIKTSLLVHNASRGMRLVERCCVQWLKP